MCDWLTCENARAFAGPFATIVASVVAVIVTCYFAREQTKIAKGQWSVAKEKLRHDLYDRRFAIYMAFHELLVAVAEKDDVEVELRKANAARAHSPFLLDAPLGAYLEELHKEAFRVNQTNKLVKDPHAWSSRVEQTSQADQLGHDKLSLSNRVEKLAKEFERFLRLKDFDL